MVLTYSRWGDNPHIVVIKNILLSLKILNILKITLQN